MGIVDLSRSTNAGGRSVHERDAQFPFLLKFLPLVLIEQAGGDLPDLDFSERVVIRDNDFTIDSKGGRHARNQVQVRSVEVGGGGKQPVKIVHDYRDRKSGVEGK